MRVVMAKSSRERGKEPNGEGKIDGENGGEIRREKRERDET